MEDSWCHGVQAFPAESCYAPADRMPDMSYERRAYLGQQLGTSESASVCVGSASVGSASVGGAFFVPEDLASPQRVANRTCAGKVKQQRLRSDDGLDIAVFIEMDDGTMKSMTIMTFCRWIGRLSVGARVAQAAGVGRAHSVPAVEDKGNALGRAKRRMVVRRNFSSASHLSSRRREGRGRRVDAETEVRLLLDHDRRPRRWSLLPREVVSRWAHAPPRRARLL